MGGGRRISEDKGASPGCFRRRQRLPAKRGYSIRNVSGPRDAQSTHALRAYVAKAPVMRAACAAKRPGT